MLIAGIARRNAEKVGTGMVGTGPDPASAQLAPSLLGRRFIHHG